MATIFGDDGAPRKLGLPFSAMDSKQLRLRHPLCAEAKPEAISVAARCARPTKPEDALMCVSTKTTAPTTGREGGRHYIGGPGRERRQMMTMDGNGRRRSAAADPSRVNNR
jgi:hypothetical protein